MAFQDRDDIKVKANIPSPIPKCMYIFFTLAIMYRVQM